MIRQANEWMAVQNRELQDRQRRVQTILWVYQEKQPLGISVSKNAYQIKISKINDKFVKRIALNEEFDVAQKLLGEEMKLDGIKYKVAFEILTQFFIQGHNVERTVIISHFSEMATSTLSYHLKI
jgi:hypothetical protein